MLTTRQITAVTLIVRIHDAIRISRDHTLSWRDRFELIFSDTISREIFRCCDKLGIFLDYCDPDQSYEDDVTAFVDAVIELKDRLTEEGLDTVEY